VVAPSAVRAGKAYVELGTLDKTAVGLKRAQRRLRAFGRSVSAAGAGLMKMAALTAVPLAIGAKAFMDFERQMAQVSTMLDDPQRHMKDFKAGIRRMAVEFGESTDALAGGLYDILSATIEPAKALDVLAASVKAAKAGLTDTATATDAIVTILNSYNLSADKAADVSDWLFAVVKKGRTDFAKLAPTIGMVASTASVAGVSLEELGAMIAVLTRNGVQTDNAITAINRTIATFLKPTDDAAAYARRLGFELSSATLKAEGIEGVFRRIANLPPDAVARLFPNIRALRGVLPALKKMDEFSGDVQLMADRAGKTEEAYRKMANTLSHQWQKMKQAAVIAFGHIGEAMREHLAAAAEKITDWGKAVALFIKRNKAMIATVAKWTVIVAAIGAGLLIAGKLIAVFSALIGVIKGVAVAVGVLKMAFTALLANPVALAITAIVVAVLALAVAFKKALDWIYRTSDAMQNLVDAGEKQRAIDRQRMQRLQQLAAKEKLSNAERREALDLTKKLNKEYGDLGIRMTETTGQLVGMAEAQKKLNAAMRANQVMELENALEEIDANIKKLKRKRRMAYGAGIGAGYLYNKWEDTSGKIEMQVRNAERMRKRLADIRSGAGTDKPAALSARIAKGKTDAAAAKAEAIATVKELADLDRRIHRLKLQQIDDERQRELALMHNRYDDEIARAKQNHQIINKLNLARFAEEANIRKKHAARYAQEQKRRAEQRATEEADLQHQIAQLQIQATRKGRDRELGLIELEEQRALARAKELGLDEALVRRVFALRRQLVSGRAAAATEMASIGSFSAGGLRGVFGGQNLAERAAKAAEATATNTRKLVRKADQGKVTFA